MLKRGGKTYTDTGKMKTTSPQIIRHEDHSFPKILLLLPPALLR